MKALFLDRDGVINIDYGYVGKIENFKFREGIFELTKQFQDNGYKIFVVTNQSGIARGYYSEEDFHKLTEWMKEEFLKRGVEIKDVKFCPHHPDISGVCECRKPEPKMILDLASEYNIDLENSILIGDSKRDIEAGEKAGIKTNILVSKEGNIFDIIKQKGLL
jgi:D-glycero-D-manno-heptose 1,7-bisphosphate phosphatase